MVYLTDFVPTSDWTTLIRNKMWYMVLESKDIWRHRSKYACSNGSKRFSNLLQNKVSSLKKQELSYYFPSEMLKASRWWLWKDASLFVFFLPSTIGISLEKLSG